jgi:integrase
VPARSAPANRAGGEDTALVPYVPAARGAAKRGNNEGSIYQLKTGRQAGEWRGRVSLPGGGRRSVSGKTRAEVAEKVARLLADVQAGKVTKSELGDGRLTVAQYLRRWLDDAVAPRVRRRTLVFYAGHVDLYLVPAIGKVRLARLTVHDVQRLLNDLGRPGRLPAPLSTTTVAYVRGTLRSALKTAIKWGLVGINAAELADAPRQQASEVTPLTVDQTRALLAAAADLFGGRLEPLLTVALATGLRQGELLALRWSDVDVERPGGGVLRVRRTLEVVPGEGARFSEPKSRAGRRTLPLIAGAAGALQRQRVRCLEARLAVGSRWKDHDLVFPSSVGTPLGPRNVYRDYQTLLAAAGLPRFRFHDLRHSTATFLLAAGVDLKTISVLLGHSQISLTMNTYAHLTPALLGDAAAKLDALFAAPAAARPAP